jgi:E3 ubiquitin-protein ligase RGLG
MANSGKKTLTARFANMFKRKGSGSSSIMISDNYKTLEEVTQALRQAGLESSNLIVGVDYTGSNQVTGERTFGGRCLHALLDGGQLNPYQEVIKIVGETLASFDDDNLIPAFGFGDIRTTNRSVFDFIEGRPCHGFDEVLRRYNEITPTIELNGPTNFGPLIRRAVSIVKETFQYHILVIVADGQVHDTQDTEAAIVEASNYPLSIVMIGVGDGPWATMNEYDDKLPARKFDNFQFVEFHAVMAAGASRNPQAYFAMHALMELPEQYKTIRAMGLLDRRRPSAGATAR